MVDSKTADPDTSQPPQNGKKATLQSTTNAHPPPSNKNRHIPHQTEEYFSSDDSGGSDAEDQKKRGNFFYKKNRYDKAISFYTRAIKKSNSEVSAYFTNRSNCYCSKEEWKKGLDDALKAEEVAKEHEENPNPKSYFFACKALFALSRFDECIEKAEEGIEKQITCGEELSKKFIAPCHKKIEEKKQREWEIKEKIVKEEARRVAEGMEKGQDPETEKKRDQMERAKAAYSGGDLMKAIEFCEMVIKSTMDKLSGETESEKSEDTVIKVTNFKYDLEAYNLMGKTFMRLKKGKEASDAFKTEIALHEKMGTSDQESSSSLDGKIATGYSNLGLALKMCGDLDAAVDNLKKAVGLLTKNNEQSIKTDTVANIMQNLGQVHRQRGDLGSAKDAYKKSLEIHTALHGPDHGTTALGYLCMARLPAALPPKKESDSDVKARLEMYDKALKILDAQGNRGKLAKVVAEIPELPCPERLMALVEGIKKERNNLADAKSN